MEEKIIDLQELFVMNNAYFVKFLNERCLNILNSFLKNKSGATHEPIFAREEDGDVRMGYIPTQKKERNFFSNELMSGYGDDTLSRICLTQYVIFEGCKAYDCFEDVPMAGAPEEGYDAFFFFTHEGTKYTFKLWTKQ